MADDISLTDGELLTACTPKNSPLSTSFTITFGDDDENSPSKLNKNKNSNMFVRRHARTSSLPAANDRLSSKDVNSLHDVERNTNGVDVLKNGLPKSAEKPTNGAAFDAPEKRDSAVLVENLDSFKSASDECDAELNGGASGDDSEGGTYTLDQDNRQVQLARKSIDQVFGISSSNEDALSTSTVDKMRTKSKMIDDWMEHSVSALESADEKPKFPPTSIHNLIKNKQYVSKIPSPVTRRRVLCSEAATRTRSNSKLVSSPVDDGVHPSFGELNSRSKLRSSSSSDEIDTESYLKETENIVVALQNRLREELGPNKVVNGREKEANKYAITKFNRAFSLRRDRSKKVSPVTGVTAIPVLTKNVASLSSRTRCSSDNAFSTGCEQRTSLQKDVAKKLTPTASNSAATKQSKLGSKKQTHQRLRTSSGGIRSTSSLSAQEIEFQNWKRRKNYDPLKAAAEDRKKKSATQSSASCSPSSAALLTTAKEKSTTKRTETEFHDKGIMRSASFHGLRNRTKFGQNAFSENNNTTHNDYFMSSSFLSNGNSISSGVLDYEEDNDWAMPKPPSTSLQNTPPESVSSRLSLLSNPASCSSVFLTSYSLSKMNLATLANVTQLSQVIRVSVSSLNNCLRSSNDENELDKIRESGLLTKIESVDEDDQFAGKNYASFSHGRYNEDRPSEVDTVENDFDKLSVDHQLKLTLDNLKQIHIVVQELQLICATK